MADAKQCDICKGLYTLDAIRPIRAIGDDEYTLPYLELMRDGEDFWTPLDLCPACTESILDCLKKRSGTKKGRVYDDVEVTDEYAY